jgi:hypothetical protein
MLNLTTSQIIILFPAIAVIITLFICARFGNLEMRTNYRAILKQIEDASCDSDFTVAGQNLLLFEIQYSGFLASCYLWHLNNRYDAKLECRIEEDFLN